MKKETRQNKRKKEMVFMIGSPAAGKSTIADQLNKKSKYIVLDCDKIKESHPDYDPKKPDKLHNWSAIELEKEFQKALDTKGNYIVDGTGSNSDKLIRRITEAKVKNFSTKLVYVTCSLKECLRRNEERPRTVPKAIVKSKYKDISYSFEAVSPHADKVEIVNNE